jgi:hypothetical protein
MEHLLALEMDQITFALSSNASANRRFLVTVQDWGWGAVLLAAMVTVVRTDAPIKGGASRRFTATRSVMVINDGSCGVQRMLD